MQYITRPWKRCNSTIGSCYCE